MPKRFLALIALSFCFFHPAGAVPSSTRMHADSAFLFAGRDNWNEAMNHATLANDPLIGKVIRWMYCKSPGSGATFDELRECAATYGAWPDSKAIQLRVEHALLREDADAATVQQWFAGREPVSGAGKIALADARGGSDIRMLREGWQNGDFDEATEIRLIAKYRTHLRPEDYTKRASRLLWEEKPGAAERMAPFLSAGEQALLRARIALQRGDRNAASLVQAVPATLQQDASLRFERMRRYDKQGNAPEAERILLTVPEDVPSPAKWWPLREKYVRKAIEQDQYQKAARLLLYHGQTQGKEQAEALWLKGWIALQFLRTPQAAYKDFYKLYENVEYPVSKARAAYWAGRAAERNGNPEIARNWYGQASAYPTTFYGQLAAEKLSPSRPLALEASPTLTDGERAQFRRQELSRVVVMLLSAGQDDLAYKFTLHQVDTAKSQKEAALASDLGIASGHIEDGVKAAKRAYQKGFLLVRSGYPILQVPSGLPIEKALTLAITRQESEFDRTARSPANALGLMQLLPGTARETAGKIGLGYAEQRLYEPAYNMTLGSHYLGRMITRFDGSYVKAIAAYNAGPGRVRQWEDSIGEPGGNLERTVDWIESIPFNETRNYVHRVLENLQVYRQLLSSKAPPLQLEDDLTQ